MIWLKNLLLSVIVLATINAFAGSPPPAVIIWKSSCASGAFNLSSQTCEQQGVFALTESGGTTTIDWSKNAGLYTLTLNANLTISFSNAVAGQTIVIRITNTASNFTVVWTGGGLSVKWPLQTAPVQTVGAFSDVYTLLYDGTNYFGSYVQDF